jgi:hypothetical protein
MDPQAVMDDINLLLFVDIHFRFQFAVKREPLLWHLLSMDGLEIAATSANLCVHWAV